MVYVKLLLIDLRALMSEPRYLEGDDYALNGVEGEEESDTRDTGEPDQMWEDED